METAQTADYALLVLIELQSKDGQSVAELATTLALNRSVIQRIIVTLHRRGMVTKNDRGRFFLGPRLISVGQDVPNELTALARPFLRDVALSAGEMAVLAVREGEDALIIAHHNGSSAALRVEYEIGSRHPLVQGASGHAILAFDGSIPGIADRKLRARLERVRDEGFARTEGEIKEGMIGIAAPVLSYRGPVGSLALVLPSIRARSIDDRMVNALRSGAAALGERYDEHIRELSEGEGKRLAPA